ncbi:MAG: hypothetical protein ACK5X3_00725 [Pseudomonadota bacterium]|jgi:hypothetical protein
MSEWRTFLCKQTGGDYLHAVRIFRYRGTWAFKDVGGWSWTMEWGFRSALAAIRAAGRWHKPDKMLRPTPDQRSLDWRRNRRRGGA